MRTIIVALVICVSASPVGATFLSGNHLYQHCGKSALEAEALLIALYHFDYRIWHPAQAGR